MKRLLFLSVILLVTISSCRRYKAFPPALVTYFPYTENQQLVFANEREDTTALTITSVYISERHSESFCSKCGWNIALEFEANNDSMSISGYMNITYTPFLQLVAGSTFYYKEFPGDPFSAQFISQIGDTIRLSYDDHEAIVVRYEGVVEFYDAKHKCVWTLVK
jgi:hypothetical protein